jgi:shikimate dehydrogenase
VSVDGLPTGSTRVLGIIGDPIAQARSPEVWSALFRLNGVDAVCIPMQVDPSGLGAFLEGAKALRNFLGLIVTIPHKASSLEHVASLTERSAQVGAVNVIRLDDRGEWTGDTVDGIGLVAGLRRRGQDPAGRRALVVGVGGAGTAIAFALAEAGASEVAVFDVDRARADEVSGRLAATGTASYVAAPDAAGFELVVNASPLGMAPDDPVPISLDGIDSSAVVADVVVHPLMTRLLQAAAERGCFTQPGVHMMDGQITPMAEFLGLGEGAWDADAVARATGAA